MTNIKRQLVPEYIQKLQVYQAGKPIDELVREKGLTKISKLASNENPLGPSPYAIKEMTTGLWNLHQYPDMHAHKLKASLSKLYNLEPKNIILGNGSEGIMAYIVRAFLTPGEEVLTSENTFIGFYILAQSVGAKIVQTELTSDFRYDVQKIISKIHDKTKVIYIANPNNPTGTYITKSEFDQLMEHVPDHVLVILDEAYYEFAKEQSDYPDSMDYRYDNVITLRTFSKAYGLAGIRVGYGFAHRNLVTSLSKVKLPFEPNLIAQLGACGAIYDSPHLNRTLENNKAEYNRLTNYLKKHNFAPIKSITNFVCLPIGSLEASNWLFEELLNKGVIIRPLKVNYMPEFIRISVGTKIEMDHFYQAFDSLITEYDLKFR